MSLYDEALAAGAPARPKLSPELIQQILNSSTISDVGGNGVQRSFTDPATGLQYFGSMQNYGTTGTGESSTVDRNVLDPIRGISRDVPNRTGGSYSGYENFDLDGNFLGYGEYGANWAEMLQAMAMVAPAVGGIVGAAGSAASGVGNGAFLGENVASGIGGWDQAFVNAGGTLEGAAALSSAVTPQAADVTTQLPPAETAALPEGAMQTIEVTGSKLPGLTPLELGTLGAGTLTAAELALPDVQAPDTLDYSNEGRNYPDVKSTQGPGGSPINSSIDPANINKLPINLNGGTDPSVNVDPTKVIDPTKPTTSPFGNGDWGNLFNVLSGLYGLKLANDAADKSDPFGPYRKGYADKLLALEANPGLLKSTPGFLAGQDTIKRQMAAKGYLGSGNMSAALMRYSGDAYQQEAGRLAQLAGAGIAPGNTHFNAADLTSRSLAGIGYGLAPYVQGGPR